MSILTPRWYPLRPVPAHLALMRSTARFKVAAAGRRSGKTERAKREVIKRGLRDSLERRWETYRYFFAAPTRDQAKAIYWSDLKALMPPRLIADISESYLTVSAITGAEFVVVGMDKPQRIEGSPWNGGVLDEYGNMKATAWPENVRPALSDRLGWAWLIGVPEGRNHYYETALRAQEDTTGEWSFHTWASAEVLPPGEVEAARRDLDELTFQQEYEASFVTFSGRAYYPFDRAVHCAPLAYDPDKPLAFAFDFNVAPGVAVVSQEQTLPNGQPGTAVVGEVWIPRNSNTPLVARRLLADWGHHQGQFEIYGDATGGASGTAKVQGSDWDLIKAEFRAIASRCVWRVPNRNPPERSRVNAVNSRLRAADGTVRLMVDPQRAPHVVRDLEGVSILEGSAGELDKKGDPSLTHISDALGYHIERRFPVVNRELHERNLY